MIVVTMIDEQWRHRQQQRQETLAATPLELRRDFSEAAKRWEAWWRFESDRPILAGAVAKRANDPDLARGKAFDLIHDPEAWFAIRERQVAALYWIDQTVPSIRADIGPVSMGAFLGAPLHFAAEDQTSWQTPILTGQWDGEVPDLDESNPWLRTVLDLEALIAERGAGRYLVCLPDLSGAIDTLANLRGTEQLLLDLYDRPEAVVAAASALNDRWARVFELMYETITSRGNAVTTWLSAWTEATYSLPTCDFDYMIGVEQFRDFCLPSLVEQARISGRCALHTDGPGAIKHMDLLAETPEIGVIQFTPGAGTPSALEWLDTWRMLQDAGKPLALACPAEEVPELCRKLDPHGLMMLVQGVKSVSHAKELEEIVKGSSHS